MKYKTFSIFVFVLLCIYIIEVILLGFRVTDIFVLAVIIFVLGMGISNHLREIRMPPDLAKVFNGEDSK